MKKSLLIVFVLLCTFLVNAQKHIATPSPAKKTFITGQFTGKPPAAACDTLKFDSAQTWSAFYYTPTEDGSERSGYVFGVSKDTLGISIKEDANYYDVSGSDYNYITGGLILFAIANSNNTADLSKNLVFKIYDDDGSGEPGNLLGSSKLTLSHIKNDVVNGALTEFKFSTPIAIPSNKIFYVSIDHSNFKWNSSTKDSIAIVANANDEAPAAAYQYWNIDGFGPLWIPVSDEYSLNLNLFIFPYVNNSIDGCSTLPVSIINFKGSVNDNKALLTWSTATELNNKGFEIERSKDGKTFTTIGFVKGFGTTTQRRDYIYSDATLSDIGVNTSYYRLKQVDLDGKASYSNVIPLSLKNILQWKLYPNPIKGKLTIELNLNKDTKVSVQVISKNGRVLLNADKGTLSQGLQQLNFDIQNMASGSYFVRIKAGDKYYTQTIVKQ